VTTVLVAFLGPWDFVIIIAVVVFVFGTARFGRTFRALKQGGREFKRGVRGGKDELPPPQSPQS
jgi:Sec-independent protein translocase protein TatA